MIYCVIYSGRALQLLKLDTTASVRKIIIGIFAIRKNALITMEMGKNAINQKSIEISPFFQSNNKKKRIFIILSSEVTNSILFLLPLNIIYYM